MRELQSEVPEALVQLIGDLLQTDPADRPPGASAVVRRLETVCTHVGEDKDRKGKQRPARPLTWLMSGNPPSARRAVRMAGAVALVGLIIFGLSVSDLFRDGLSGPQAERVVNTAGFGDWTPRLGAQSIAVLPFTYLSAEDSSDYFSQGMTDELLIRLSQLEDLSVISRTSVMRYLNSDKTIPEIARELGVAYVLEGNVQHVGGQVRIQAQLIDARTDRHVWADGITRPYTDVLRMQVDLAREIVRELAVTMLPETERRLAAAPEVDSTAYSLFLQGRRLHSMQTGENLALAGSLLQRSVEIDPSFAAAWAELATCTWLAHEIYGTISEDVNVDSLTRTAARRAIELDSTSAYAHIAVGIVRQMLDLDYPSAGPHLKRAVELNPGLEDAHLEYGIYLWRMGQYDAAETYFRRAARLDPSRWMHVLAGLELSRGNHTEASKLAREILSVRPDQSGAVRVLGRVLIEQDSLEAGLRELRHGVRLSFANRNGPIPSTHAQARSLAHLGRAYALAGRPDSARYVLDLIERSGRAWGKAAIVYTALGDHDRALDLLELASGHDLSFIKFDPAYDPLRDEPRFQRLLESAGLDDRTVRQTMRELGESPS